MTRLIIALTSIALIFSIACGSDDKDGGGITGGASSNNNSSSSSSPTSSGSGSNPSSTGNPNANSKDPVKYAEGALVALFGLFNGSTNSQQMLGLYAPECRTGVKTSDIDQVLTLVRAFFPEMAKVKITEVDLSQANPKVEKSGATSKITLGDPSKMRLKVDGQFKTAAEVSKQMGFPNLNDSPLEVADEPLTVKEVDGKLYIADCDSLQDITRP